VRQACVDASIIIKWYKPENEHDRDAALRLRRAFDEGETQLVAPSLLALELVNSLGRRWNWPAVDLRNLVPAFADLGLQLVEPDLGMVVDWVLRGLTAYDAAYVAVAEELGHPLVTADARLIAAAAGIAVHVADF
jgi:predicted nucleic acid-binding protein